MARVRKILILFAHPALQKSRVHARLLAAVRDLPGVTVHDLYEQYPDFAVDVEHEQALLREHDVIVTQHPLYWYSAPALVKEWQDLVLEHGFAYGAEGKVLRGKLACNVLSTGGPSSAYQNGGYNRHTLREFLFPFEQTARLCEMIYLAPFAVSGVLRMDPTGGDIDPHAERYADLLIALRDGTLDLERAQRVETLNEVVPRRASPHASSR